MKRGSGLIEVRKQGTVVGMVAVLAAATACTVGEARPGPVPERPGVEPADTAAAPVADTAARADEYGATDLLIRSQLAYEAARVDSALALAERVLVEHPGSGSVEPARWLGARAAFALGRYERAREMARSYADRQPAGSTLRERALELAELAEDALAPPAAGPVIGAVLPRSGPRVLVRYADWILEGIELAVQEAERHQGRPIDLVVVDDAGGARTEAAVEELERRGALAIVGPLLPRQVAAAASARRDPRRVVISPTAAGAGGWPETYTLSDGDGRGAQELGQYAADVGFRQAALLYARTMEHELKAQAFAVEYESLGGDVRAYVPYDSGTTTFGPHMERILAAVAPRGAVTVDSALVDSLVTLGILPSRAAAEAMPPDTLRKLAETLAPDTIPGVYRMRERMPLPHDSTDPWLGRPPQRPFALFVAASPQDVPKIAPQVSFYGLDSAGVQVFGDEAWTTADVRRVVPARDLEGVIAASHFPPERANRNTLAAPSFVRLYEDRYRRSLDNRLPALGYDAANLVLQALPNRMFGPDALARRFHFLAGIEGATGVLSVRADRVVRTPYLVTIEGGQLTPAPFPWDYVMPVPVPPLPDASRGGARR